MRIDAALPLPENQPTSKAANAGTSAPQGRTAPAGSTQDQTQLTADSATVQQLQASLSQVPEVRQDRVDALRQALGSGTYQVSNQQLGDAIGQDLLAGQLRLM